MATITICDMCKRKISNEVVEDLYTVTSSLKSGLVNRNDVHPTFKMEVCKKCAKEIKNFIDSNTKESVF